MKKSIKYNSKNIMLNLPCRQAGLFQRLFYFGRFRNKFGIIIFLFIIIIFINSCTDKFDTTVFNTSSQAPNLTGDTVYIQLSPVWEGFNNPQDILIGREPFIYVADMNNDRIVMLNLDGKILGTRTITKPVALAQDYELNLIVCAQFDTLGKSFSAVYKIDLFAASHQIQNAPIKRLLPRQSDFNTPLREYTGAAVFYDNSFYIARRGPNNSNLIDPDNSILIFRKKRSNGGIEIDTLIGRVPLLDPSSTGLLSANQVSSITSFANRSYDVILTLGENNNFKVQWLQYINTQDFTGYQNKLSPSNTDIMKPNRFAEPQRTTIDNSGNIFIADAVKDSIFKFNSFGDELQSFGGSNLFKQPRAVAFFDRTLYVLDTGNNRVLRFILSTDI